MNEQLTHIPLFAGINGFGVAADWMGWNQPFHCEIDSFCQKIIQYYWPNSKPYYDIRETDFTIHRGEIDILTGGFPCQPYSTAGKRLGKEDDRHLWPEMLRAIREIQPRFVVGENVAGLLSWNEGVVFNEVQTDLETEGYEVQPVLLPACAVNAPHRRERVWFVAHSTSYSCNNAIRDEGQRSQKVQKKRFNEFIASTNTSSDGCKRAQESEKIDNRRIQKRVDERHESNSQNGIGNVAHPNNTQNNESTWGNFPTQSPICSGNDGLSNRLDGITFPKWRQESIKAYGNAIVPQVAFQIFKAISELEENPD